MGTDDETNVDFLKEILQILEECLKKIDSINDFVKFAVEGDIDEILVNVLKRSLSRKS